MSTAIGEMLQALDLQASQCQIGKKNTFIRQDKRAGRNCWEEMKLLPSGGMVSRIYCLHRLGASQSPDVWEEEKSMTQVWSGQGRQGVVLVAQSCPTLLWPHGL